MRARKWATGSLFVIGALSFAAAIAPRAARAAASGWVGNRDAAVRLITAEEATGSNRIIDAGLEIRLGPGWHAYWRNPGAAGLPPSIDWKGSKNFGYARIEWPAPRRFVLDGLQTYGYANRVVLPIAVAPTKPGDAVLLHASVSYSACRTLCVPHYANLTLALPAGTALPGPEAGLIARASARVPSTLHALGLSLLSARVAPDGASHATLAVALTTHGQALRRPDLFVEGLSNDAPGPPRVTTTTNGQSVLLTLADIAASPRSLLARPLTFTLTDAGARAASFKAQPVLGAVPVLAGARGGVLMPLAILATALLGGLILNVMPCVLPVLGLKLMGIARLAGAQRREVRIDLLTTAAGVIAGFLGLSAALIGLKAAGGAVGWGIQFQQPWFLAAMTMVMALFAADMWGWITIDVPLGLGNFLATRKAGSRRGDAFLAGLFATLLATSCSAPFVGTAVGFALSRGAPDILAIFLAMGIGMALPYLGVSAAPQIATRLPRPGRWMIVLRVILGALLVATGAWLLTVLGSLGYPREAGAVGVLGLGLLGVLAFRGRRLVTPLRRDLAGGLAALLIVAGLGVPLAGAALLPPAAPREHAHGGAWRPFARASIAENVAAGRIVFVNVTADWCLICKVNELTVFDRAPVAQRLAQPGVLAMEANWTRADPAITRYLQSFGRYGVPLDVVYGPGAPMGIALPELVTSAEVLRAFEQAGGKNIQAGEG